MPVLRYFIVVGLFLIGMLYVADAVLPHNTRLQVTSNFEGIPPAPQRPFHSSRPRAGSRTPRCRPKLCPSRHRGRAGPEFASAGTPQAVHQ